MNKLLLIITAILYSAVLSAQGYAPGDRAEDFELKNIDEKMLRLSSKATGKGAIVVFTCNHCPFAKLYEDRVNDLNKKYAAKGFPVIAINPNDPADYEEDSFENMQLRAKQKNFTFPYLVDETQEVTKKFGATKTPNIYVLSRKNDVFTVEYVGAIDDNSKSPKDVKVKYVENAVNNLLAGKKPQPQSTKAVGCSIKWK